MERKSKGLSQHLRIGVGEISSVLFVTLYTELTAHHAGKKFVRDRRYIDCLYTKKNTTA